MVWDINPITSGFEVRNVTWRGNGTPENSQFDPKIFNLTAGSHTFYIVGREPNTRLDKLTITLQ